MAANTTGKYIKLLYDRDCRLMGASTDHFLLEKSRLVKVDSGERGYHIFYQVNELTLPFPPQPLDKATYFL